MPSVTRASQNTTAPTAYASTQFNVKDYQLAVRHFGRYLIVHALYSRGLRITRATTST